MNYKVSFYFTFFTLTYYYSDLIFQGIIILNYSESFRTETFHIISIERIIWQNEIHILVICDWISHAYQITFKTHIRLIVTNWLHLCLLILCTWYLNVLGLLKSMRTFILDQKLLPYVCRNKDWYILLQINTIFKTNRLTFI